MVKIETTLPNEKKTKKKSKKKNGKHTRLTVLLVLGILFIFALAFGYWLYKTVMSPNVQTTDGKEVELFIPTGSDYNQVKNLLAETHCITNEKSFDWVAQKKELPANIHPGHYILKNGMSNNLLVNMLRGGLQTPVKVKFNNMRDVDQLAGRIAQQIEADSASIANLLHNQQYVNQLGFNPYTLPALFLPDTYEFYWNTDAEGFVNRIFQEYNKFWNEERKQQAQAKGLTPVQVSTLAAIVNKETNMTDEMPRVAGVYINRLKNNWLLQADPTLIFAWNDYSIRRVLDRHKEIESPYNTYKYIGLPPGPICIPSIAAIKAVLNAEDHHYFYFCAKEDFSGYHNFAKTLAEHNRNAAKYQQALNQRGIK
ncbi:MAG: endolytic transglycosylase MltG [Bacteroidales bacterium]|nr:endolytic transglycosylase MltG [Bacteroidales bacterium]